MNRVCVCVSVPRDGRQPASSAHLVPEGLQVLLAPQVPEDEPH